MVFSWSVFNCISASSFLKVLCRCLPVDKEMFRVLKPQNGFIYESCERTTNESSFILFILSSLKFGEKLKKKDSKNFCNKKKITIKVYIYSSSNSVFRRFSRCRVVWLTGTTQYRKKATSCFIIKISG